MFKICDDDLRICSIPKNNLLMDSPVFADVATIGAYGRKNNCSSISSFIASRRSVFGAVG